MWGEITNINIPMVILVKNMSHNSQADGSNHHLFANERRRLRGEKAKMSGGQQANDAKTIVLKNHCF
jgi:hypothetical protein